jgi:hypothetical protein
MGFLDKRIVGDMQALGTDRETELTAVAIAGNMQGSV